MDRDKLIAAVYSASMTPENYDDIMETIDDLVFDQRLFENMDETFDVAQVGNHYAIDPEILAHIKRAQDIQAQLGRRKVEKPKMKILLDAAPNPAFVFNQTENIIAMNGLAENGFQTNSNKLADCCDNKFILASIRKFIKAENGKDLLVEPGYLNAGKNTNTCILVRKMREGLKFPLQEKHQAMPEKLYFCTIIDLGFDSSKTDIFRKTYGLTHAEVDIAIELSSGRQLPEIADERGASIATIRTQFKSIKKKTESRDIPSVVRLLCGFSAGILISSQLSTLTSTAADTHGKHTNTHQIKLGDGRQLAYLEQGCPDGNPVIMLHTMPYGLRLLNDAKKAATRMGLRFISPFRPGYGATEMPNNIDGEKILNLTAKDICELLDFLKIAKADIMGVGVGPVYALRFASLYPNRVGNLFSISRPPIWRDEWMDNMPKRQRLMLRLAKYTPQLLPLMLRATMAYIDKGHAQDLFRTTCAESAADMNALNNPEICALLEREFVEGLRQGTKAVRLDCFTAIKDFNEEAKRIKHRFHILHGDDDKVFDVAQSQAFIDMIPGTELEIVKNAGHFLLYSHWQHVLRAIKKKHP